MRMYTISGGFSNPASVAVDNNYIYVTNWDNTGDNNNLQIFNRSSRMNVYNISGSFNRPSGVAVDTNYIYVMDSGNRNVQIFNK